MDYVAPTVIFKGEDTFTKLTAAMMKVRIHVDDLPAAFESD